MDALEQLIEGLAARVAQKQLGRGFKHDTAGNPISVGFSHGPGGNLTFPGVDQDVFHTVISGRGILSQLPASGSLFTNPTYTTLTGVQGLSGSAQDGDCGDAPQAGLMKVCTTTSAFGRIELATPEIELNRLGQRNDRSDPMDLRLVGSPIDGQGIFSAGARDPSAPGNVLQSEIARKFWELNIAAHRIYGEEIWTGVPGGSLPLGVVSHMTGFETLVRTGYVDVETNQSCPSMDSIIRNFGTRVDGNCDNLVAAVTSMYYEAKDRARRMRVEPVRWVLAMREQLFYELSRCWPCSYLTDGCSTNGDQKQIVVQADVQRRMQEDMYQGSYLLIDGERVEVVQDDGIPETVDSPADGCFSTDIYLIPMSVVGGRSVTYLEYFQYQNSDISQAISRGIDAVIEGAWITTHRQTNFCFVFQTKSEPRLVLRTPWLAGRLENVAYCPVQHTRSPFPADPYHVDGGRTSRTGPSLFTPW